MSSSWVNPKAEAMFSHAVVDGPISSTPESMGEKIPLCRGPTSPFRVGLAIMDCKQTVELLKSLASNSKTHNVRNILQLIIAT